MRPAICFLVLAAMIPAQQKRPNLLLIVTDDQRFDQLGCAGHPVLQTPVSDRLAANGVRFRNAFVTTAICAASRASIMTGRREGKHGCTFGKPAMGRELGADTYFARLHDAGYHTGFVGKWGVNFEKGAVDAALDFRRVMAPPYVQPGKAHLTVRTADAAIEFLRTQDDKAPFCLTVCFNAPHAGDDNEAQFIPPPDLASLYADAEVPEPPFADTGCLALPDFLQHSMGRTRWHWRFTLREQRARCDALLAK